METGQLLCQHVHVSKKVLVYLYKTCMFTIVAGVFCGNPGTPRDGSTTVTSDTVGSIAQHFCDGGFSLVGLSQRECLANGSWSGSLPTCKSKQLSLSLPKW